MKNLIAWFVKNPVAANLIMVAMIVGGIFGRDWLSGKHRKRGQRQRQCAHKASHWLRKAFRWGQRPRRRKYDLTFSQVAAAIGGSSVNLSAGTVETSGGNLQLRARSLANDRDTFEQIIVRQTSDGAKVRVRDIANVIDGFDNDKFSAKFRGENTAIFQVQSPDEMNISDAGDAIREFEAELNQSLPPSTPWRAKSAWWWSQF